MKKATDKEILDAYKRLKNVPKVAAEFNMASQNVWKRLKKLNVRLKGDKFTKEERALLREKYSMHADAGTINVLAKIMGRHKTSICAEAKKMGLTNTHREKKHLKKFDEKKIRKLWDEFKKTQKLTIVQFCARRNIHSSTFSKACKKQFPGEWELTLDGRELKGTRYKLGRAFEYRVKAKFEKIGYFVLRSPRSKGPADLVAIKKGRILFIQCKRGHPVWGKEKNILIKLAESVGAEPLGIYSAGFRDIKIRKYVQNDWEELPLDNFK